MYNKNKGKIFVIVWIASYPKSGNTWVRAIISSVLFSDDGRLDDFSLLDNIDQYPTKKYFETLIKNYNNPVEIQENWIPSQRLINYDKKIRFFKTHHIFCKYGINAFTDNLNTMGVIHVVRDPRDLVSSIKNHWSLQNDHEAMVKLFDEQNATGLKINKNHDYSFPVIISSWKNHYIAWSKIKKNYLLIKYEDLVNDPEKQLKIILKYLKKFFRFKIDDNKIKNILETTTFEHFEKLEEKKLFKESNLDQSGRLKKFFNNNPNKINQKKLNNEIRKQIEDEFNSELKELEYI